MPSRRNCTSLTVCSIGIPRSTSCGMPRRISLIVYKRQRQRRESIKHKGRHKHKDMMDNMMDMMDRDMMIVSSRV